MSKWDDLSAEEKNQLVHEWVMERHSEYIFCYSQNMAAAWLVMQHIHKTWDQPSKNTWYAPKRKQFLYELQRLGNIANKPGLYIDVGATLITLAIVSLGIAIAWIAYIFLWLGLHEHRSWSREERQHRLASDPVSSAFRFLFGLILHIWLFPVWLISTIRDWHEMRVIVNSVKAQGWRVRKDKDGYIALMSQEEFERRYGEGEQEECPIKKI